MYEFFMNLWTFFSVYHLFDDVPHFPEIILIWKNFWSIIIIFFLMVSYGMDKLKMG